MILYNTIVGLAAGVGLLLVVKLLNQFTNGEKVQSEGFLLALRLLPEIQVVLAIGRNIKPETLGTLPKNVIVVGTAPQIQLVKRASLCITCGSKHSA